MRKPPDLAAKSPLDYILKKVNLRLKSLKLEFYVKEIKFIEYIVRKNRL
jgi:hypothetical protein